MFKPIEAKGSQAKPKLSSKSLSQRKFNPKLDLDFVPTGRNARRRITAVDPNLKLSEVARVPKASGGKLVVPDSDKVFQFSCGGQLDGDSQLAGKYVEWKATFERPIEQLIYPSLQRFDMESYDRKIKLKQKLHGRSEPLNVNVNNNISSMIKLEPLPDSMMPTNEEIVFLHTPHWTVQIKTTNENEYNSDSPNKNSTGSPSENNFENINTSIDNIKLTAAPNASTSLSLTYNNAYNSISQELDIEGEKYLRNKIKTSLLEKRAETANRIRKERERYAAAILASPKPKTKPSSQGGGSVDGNVAVGNQNSFSPPASPNSNAFVVRNRRLAAMNLEPVQQINHHDAACQLVSFFVLLYI